MVTGGDRLQFWAKMKDWGRKALQRTQSAAGIAREYKTVFELGNVPSFGEFYDFGIFLWKQIYKGFYRPWHVLPAPTVTNEKATRQVFRMNAAKAVCAEIAGLVWGEECAVNVSINGRENAEDDPLNAFIQHVLADNSFR